jgi:hypothetical protein
MDGQPKTTGCPMTTCKCCTLPLGRTILKNIIRWAAQQGLLAVACSPFQQPNNSPQEISDINSAIQSVSSATSVDPRFILAIMMQESGGCVRVWSTVGSVTNPGLMQDHDGTGTCNTGTSGSPGVVSNPCPSSAITQMIHDGTSGTATGEGLQGILSGLGGTSDVSAYYTAARIYNSGSLGTTDGLKNLGAGGATHCYSSDIANRLLGWNSGPTGCNQATIGSDDGTEVGGGSTPSASVTIATTAQATTPTPTTEAGVFFASPTAATPVPAASSSTTTILVYPTPEATSTTTTPDPAPTTTTTPPPAATTTPASSTSSTTGAEPAGSPCTEEGMFNCVGGNSFQQCGSGTWSVVQSLAAGTSCNPGQTQDLIISKPKRARRFEKARIPVWV